MKKKSRRIIISVASVLLAAIIGVGIRQFQIFYKPASYVIASASDIMKEDTKLIAHRGFRAVAPENTLPAFEEAGKAGYWGAECDVYRTADGVWVVQHDYVTFRMMNAIKKIEGTDYEDLIKLNTNNGINIDKYEALKICTLEEYLEACKRYHMTAVIELKGKNNTEHYDEITALAEKYSVTPVYISFELNNLVKIREADRKAMLLYLVDEISEEAIKEAKTIDNCGIDFNIDKEKNFKSDAIMIKKCKSNGMPLGAWSVDDREMMKKLVNLGVEYITTDCITG